MNLYNKESYMLTEAKKSKFQPNTIIQILVFLVALITTNIAASIIPSIYMIYDMFKKNLFSDPNNIIDYSNNLPSNVLILTLICTAFVILLTIIHCRFIEKRSIPSMGLIKEGAVKQYLLGYLVGIILISTAFFIAVISGTIDIHGFNSNIAIGMIILFFIGFLIQGMSEEVLLRGYFMVSLSNKAPMLAAVIINSVFFALLHLFNGGITFLAIVNLTLFGIFASIYTLKTENLWGICAVHSAWNFFQGNIFGIKVSGLNTSDSILNITSKNSSSIINGGSFGLEGGLAVSIVLIIGIIALLIWKGRKK